VESERLADHLVRLEEDEVGNRQAKGLGGLDVDQQVELDWSLHRQGGGIGTLQNLTDVRQLKNSNSPS
jgi:hypothetical protein